MTEARGGPQLSLRLRKLVAFVRLGRPKFLLGGVALYALGALVAMLHGAEFDPAAYWVGQLAVSAIQLMTHYSNDYFDYHADRANSTPTRWSGGSRVLVAGQLHRSVALRAALVLAGIACCAIAIIALWPSDPKPVAAGILTLMLLLSWCYSSPPLHLHTRGLGEPTVMIVVPLLTPLAAFVLQTGQLAWSVVLLSVPLCLLQLVMLLTLEFPDHQGDRAVGKRTWIVLFGAKTVAYSCAALLALAFGVSFMSGELGVPDGVIRAWVWIAPLGLFQFLRMLARDWEHPKAWEGLCFGAVSLFFLSVVADLIALYRIV